MKMTLGDTFRRIVDGKKFRLERLGDYMWVGRKRIPFVNEPQVKLVAKDGEVVLLESASLVSDTFTKGEE